MNIKINRTRNEANTAYRKKIITFLQWIDQIFVKSAGKITQKNRVEPAKLQSAK